MAYPKTIDRLDRIVVFLLCGYAALCTISVPGANLFIDAALVLAAVRVLLSRGGLPFDRGLFLAAAAMVGAAALAGIFAEDPSRSSRPVWHLLYHMAPMFLALLFIRGTRQASWMVAALAASLGISSVYSLFQVTQGVWRPAGFTGDWFILAGQLCILVPFLYALEDRDTALPPRLRQFLYATLCLAVAAAAVNATRGAWLALAGSGLVYAAFFLRTRRQLLKLAGVLLLAAVLVAGAFAASPRKAPGQFMGRGPQTAFQRMIIWQSALHMIGDHPVLGIGPGNFAPQYQFRYILPEARERKSQPHAHNNFLSVASEMGLVGLAAFFALFWHILRHYWRKARTTPDNARLWAVLLASLGFQLHGLSDYTFLSFPTVVQTYWFLIGLFWNHPYR